MSKKDLIERIRSGDPKVRGAAWQGAGDAGPEAVAPLADVAADEDFEVKRAAKRALWKIVRHAGRPGAGAESTESNTRGGRPPAAVVVAELTKLLDEDRDVAVRREVLWMLSELAGGGAAVERAAELLSHAELREDARMALERIPGEESLAALRKGLATAPDDFKPNLAQSLRARGVDVPGLPCRKLVPTRQTSVKATAP